MAGKFNINNLLGGIPAQSGEGAAAERETESRPTLKVIPININDLIPSNDNFYSVENIAELKSSIELFGVVQPLAVKPLECGKYRIIAGHRRHTACAELVQEGKLEYEYVPCGIQGERDEIKERILLIMTNSTARELSDWEKMKQAEELQKHFSILKKRDNLPGRVRDIVAEALNTSSTQVARMDAIAKNLTPEFTEEFRAGRLGLSAAYELSGMDRDQQKEAFAGYQEKGGLSINDVKTIKQDMSTPPNDQSKSLTQAQHADTRERFAESMGRQSFAQPEETAAPPPTAEPRPERSYPETPPDFEEGQEDEPAEPETRDFSDFTDAEKAEAAIVFISQKRFSLFAPGQDTRVLDFIIECLEQI